MEKIDYHFKRVMLYHRFTLGEYQNDLTAQDIVEYNLFQTINHFIDMMQHIVTDEGYGFPQTAYESAEILKKQKIFTQRDLEIIRQMIGFRNVIGHEYIDIDKRIVYEILTKRLSDIQRMVGKLARRFL